MKPKLKRVFLPKLRYILVGLMILLLFFGVYKFMTWTNRLSTSMGLTPSTILELIFDNGSQLKSTDGRTNLLILGIGGGDHAGADLTDTMLVLSIDLSKNDMAMISLPRDIWSDTLKDKLNSAYHYGEEKKPGGGLVLSKAIVFDMTGLPIHYSVVVDFSRFTQLIDILGGIDINIPTSFTDSDYPIAGKENDLCFGDPKFRCRYEVVQFDAGLQHLDGQQALKYVRSRHAEGDEGTDFARGRRQQEVFLALKDTMLQPKTWKSMDRVGSFFQAVDSTTDTDMKLVELFPLGKRIAAIPKEKTRKISLDTQLEQGEPFTYEGRYVLVPTEGFQSLHLYIRSELTGEFREKTN